MYRTTELRLPCSVCGLQTPRAALALTPGGQICWGCDMRRQIATHNRLALPERQPWLAPLATCTDALSKAVILAILACGALWLLMVVVWLSCGHSC